MFFTTKKLFHISENLLCILTDKQNLSVCNYFVANKK